MRKLKRPRIVKEFIEGRIAKNQRRIQRIAEENFKLRQQLTVLEAELVKKATPVVDHEPVMDSADQEIGSSL